MLADTVGLAGAPRVQLEILLNARVRSVLLIVCVTSSVSSL